MSKSRSYITLDDIVSECLDAEGIGGRTLRAPLVGYDTLGALRYITAWDVHTVEEGGDEEERFGARVTSARLVFRFGDIADA